jgi:hypothetical protein
MLTERQFFGGSTYIVEDQVARPHYLGSKSRRFVRVVSSGGGGGGPGGIGGGSGTLNMHLPDGPDFTEGGPIFIISNGSDEDVRIKTRSGGIIGLIPAGTTGYVFLRDRYANDGSGLWALAGSGTSGTVGDQGSDSSEGFNYGSGPFLQGLGRDLGDETPNSQPEGSADMDFANAVVPINPVPPL